MHIKKIARMGIDVIKVCDITELPRFFKDYFEIKNKIDKKIEPLQKYRQVNPGESFEKYLQLDYWVYETLLRFYYLGLHKSSKKLKILDIGTGMGYFPYICNYFGHSAEAIDMGLNELYELSVDALQVNKNNERITAFTPLSIKNKYDLITGFMICFNGHKSANLWHTKEWQYFLKSLHNNNLLNDGNIFLSLNEELDEKEPISLSLLQYFIDRGAEVATNKIKIGPAYRFV